jgi:hypothetical protein
MSVEINKLIDSIESYPYIDTGSPGYNTKVKELIYFSRKQLIEIESLNSKLSEFKRELDLCRYPDGIPDHVYYSEIRRNWLYLHESDKSEE